MGEADRVDVLGVGISCVDIPIAVETIGTWITNSETRYVCVTGMHGVMESQTDGALRDIHNRSGLTTADGMPLVWCARWAGVKRASRVYGPDLMLAVCARAVEEGWSSYFVGGAEGVAERLVQRLRGWFPGLKVVGWESPPFRTVTPEEDRATIARINQADPDIVWVGLGTPKQERWMADHHLALNAHVLVGVGAAFDMHAGVLKQAPRWMQQSGLEWVYRLAIEPQRLWRRYLLNIPQFVLALVRRPPRVVVRSKACR